MCYYSLSNKCCYIHRTNTFELIYNFQSSIKADTRDLREKVESMGLFKVDPWFFIAHLGHIILLEILAYFTMSYLGYTWTSFFLVTAIMTTSQVGDCLKVKMCLPVIIFLLCVSQCLNVYGLKSVPSLLTLIL